MIRAGLILLALLAPTTGREAIGVWHTWGAFREGDPARCFAIAEPVRRGAGAFASIATWPGRGIRNQVAIRLSYPVRDGQPPTLSIDQRRFTLTARGSEAWGSEPDSLTLVRPPGFEPGTIRLKVGCSTTELRAPDRVRPLMVLPAAATPREAGPGRAMARALTAPGRRRGT